MRDQTEVTERRRITWGQYDQAAAEANLRRLRRRSCLTLLGVSLAFCCFLSLLTNVAQSCRGAAALRPYNWLRRRCTPARSRPTSASASSVSPRWRCIAIKPSTRPPIRQPRWWPSTRITATSASGHRFILSLKTSSPSASNSRGAAALRPYNCRYVLGYRSCVQISAHPLNVGSELYIQEMGGAQKMPEG
jgi:hypothetical protein